MFATDEEPMRTDDPARHPDPRIRGEILSAANATLSLLRRSRSIPREVTE
jgi:hypothetical protein